MGKGFHAGMSLYNSNKQAGIPASPELISDVAVQSVRMERDRLEAGGATVASWDQAQASSLEKRVETAIRKYVANDPIEWPISDVERILPAWGDCIIDLACEHPLGPVVIDYKVKLSLDTKYFDKEVARYRTSEQRMHYSAGYGEYIGRPVYAFYICLVVLEPSFRTHLIPFIVDPISLAMWREARERGTWRVMEMEDNGEIGVGMAAKHSDEYGNCEFQGACFDAHLDENLMGIDYFNTRIQALDAI